MLMLEKIKKILFPEFQKMETHLVIISTQIELLEKDVCELQIWAAKYHKRRNPSRSVKTNQDVTKNATEDNLPACSPEHQETGKECEQEVL